MSRDKLLTSWLAEEKHPFEGWDFSYLKDRMFETKPPWSYMKRSAELMQNATSMIDFDTGGGERLLELKDHWAQKVVATEEYPPNIELATRNLASHGVNVLSIQLTESSRTPFDDDEFDLILNRHAVINPNEFARILAQGGTFFTEQVHGLWAWDLVEAFGISQPTLTGTPEATASQLEKAGLEIVNIEDWRGTLSFSDVGAIVYYLKAVSWTVPGFTVETHQDYLFALQEKVDAGEKLEFTAALYLLEARKPAM